MEKIFEDIEYFDLVKDILAKKEFNEIDSIAHHGTTRYQHSVRVSYYGYKIAKKLRLDSVAVARAGLLHDFFMSSPDRTKFERMMSTFTHPKFACRNASSMFKLNNKEKDIIISHMFPVNYRIPKYAESWLVSFVDKGVATYEFFGVCKHAYKYAVSFIGVVIFKKII